MFIECTPLVREFELNEGMVNLMDRVCNSWPCKVTMGVGRWQGFGTVRIYF